MNDKLAAALVAAQKEMPAVEKTARANYGTYATLDHIIALTRPVLNKHGLTITQWPTVTELGQPALRTTITHISGESDSSVMPLFMAKQDMQQLGSALTYGRRYAWAAALAISSESDDDGAATTEAAATKPKKAAVSGGAAVPAGQSETAAPSETAFKAPNPALNKASAETLAEIDAQLAVLAKLRGKDVKEVRAQILATAKADAFTSLSQPQALQLLKKMRTWQSNIEKEQAAA